jgi:hypothetical protein
MKQIIKDIDFEEVEDEEEVEILEVSEYDPEYTDVLVWIQETEISLLTRENFEDGLYSWRCLFAKFIEGNGYSGTGEGFGDIKEAINHALTNTYDGDNDGVYVVNSPEELASLLDELY